MFLLVTSSFVTALGDAFLPVFVRASHNASTISPRRLVRLTVTLNVMTMTAVTIALIFGRQPIFALLTANFDDQTRQLSQTLLILMAPAIVLAGASGAMLPILNVRNRMKLAAIIPIVTPFVTFLALTFLPQPSILVLPATLTPKRLELILASFGLFSLGYSIRPTWPRPSDLPQISMWVRQCIPLAIAGILATGSVAIDQGVASTLGTGSVSSLSFGTRVTLAIVGIGSLALSAFVFPDLSAGSGSGLSVP